MSSVRIKVGVALLYVFLAHEGCTFQQRAMPDAQ